MNRFVANTRGALRVDAYAKKWEEDEAALGGDHVIDLVGHLRIYEHEIGPREIKEAYSMAVQILHGGPGLDDARQFECLAVERILLKEPGAVTQQQIIAMCHWALQSPNPGVHQLDLVRRVHDEDSRPAAEALQKSVFHFRNLNPPSVA